MIFKKKEFFLSIFLILMQSCDGGKIGNFLESSFSDLEKMNQDGDLKNNLTNKKNVLKERKEINAKNIEKIKKVEKPQKDIENKKAKNIEKIKKVEKPQKDIKNKKAKNFENLNKKKNNKIKNPSLKRKIELQSYKIIFILKDVDPKDPTKDLSTILRNSEVNFEIEKIERILDSKKEKYE